MRPRETAPRRLRLQATRIILPSRDQQIRGAMDRRLLMGVQGGAKVKQRWRPVLERRWMERHDPLRGSSTGLPLHSWMLVPLQQTQPTLAVGSLTAWSDAVVPGAASCR